MRGFFHASNRVSPRPHSPISRRTAWAADDAAMLRFDWWWLEDCTGQRPVRTQRNQRVSLRSCLLRAGWPSLESTCKLVTTCDVELHVHVTEMGFDGFARDEQPLSDIWV